MRNKIQAVLFMFFIAAVILPFIAMSFAGVENDRKDSSEVGKLYIKDSRDHFLHQYHDEMNILHKIMKDPNSSQFDRDGAAKRIDEIKKLSKQGPLIPEMKYNKIKVHIDTLGLAASDLRNVHGIQIVSIGTNFENHSVDVGINRSGLDDEKIKDIESILRKYIGNEDDITISYADPIYFSNCSQTDDCNPVQGGVKISVGSKYCSSGFKATYNGATGFVTAGHCNGGATGDTVGQPTALFPLGTLVLNTFKNGTWCDCAFVDSDETTSSYVFDGQITDGYLYPTMYDWLELEGASSRGIMGGIVDPYVHIQPQFYPGGPTYDIYGVVKTTAQIKDGDSGGSVIDSTTEIPMFAGIMTSGDGTYGWYTPHYRMTVNMNGLTLG